MTSKEVKEYLRQIKKVDTQIKNKNIEFKQCIELELPTETTLERIEELKTVRKAIIATIEQLPEAEYDILHRVYIQGETLYEVAAGRHTSYSLVTTIHGKALKRLGEILSK